MDEATDSSKECLLIAYVRFIDGEDLREDLLFCKHVTTRVPADQFLKMIDTYLSVTLALYISKKIRCVGAGVCVCDCVCVCGRRITIISNDISQCVSVEKNISAFLL